MTIQAELWQLVCAALVPTSVVIFSAGKQSQKIKALEEKAAKVEGLPERLARIETKQDAHKDQLDRIEQKLDK